jgi:glycosyltransferase involved in cell wall biosynthesis
MKPLKISIVIPVKPGGKVKALRNLSRLEYPPELFEILVAEGRRPSAQRNHAAARASGEILYFLDDDSLAEPHCLARLSSHYRSDPALAAVGGPSLTPADDSLLQKAIGLIFISSFGGGCNRNRYRQTGEVRETDDNELILCNLSFRREMFLEAGGLDERLYPNEENELLHRLKAAGKRLLHDPHLSVYRSQRPSYNAFVKQIFGYGRGRGEQVCISKEIKIFTFVPSLFILYLLSLPFFPDRIYAVPLVAYGILDLWFSFFQMPADKYRIALLKAILFPTLHLCYGAGLLAGLVRPRFLRTTDDAGGVQIRTIKSMNAN